MRRLTTAKIIRLLAAMRRTVSAPATLTYSWASSLGGAYHDEGAHLVARIDCFLALPHHKQRRRRAIALHDDLSYRLALALHDDLSYRLALAELMAETKARYAEAMAVLSALVEAEGDE